MTYDPLKLIQFALGEGIPIQIVDFGKAVQEVYLPEQILLDPQGDRVLPPKKAILRVEAPVAVGKDLQQPADQRDCYILIHIPPRGFGADELAHRRAVADREAELMTNVDLPDLYGVRTIELYQRAKWGREDARYWLVRGAFGWGMGLARAQFYEAEISRRIAGVDLQEPR